MVEWEVASDDARRDLGGTKWDDTLACCWELWRPQAASSWPRAVEATARTQLRRPRHPEREARARQAQAERRPPMARAAPRGARRAQVGAAGPAGGALGARGRGG